MADPITVLGSGLGGLLEAFANLIPLWQSTAHSVDTTAQAVTQIASAQTVPTPVNVTVQQGPAPTPIQVPLPEEFKGQKDKADRFIRQCNLYFTRVRIEADEEKIATALALIKGEDASVWAETQLEAIQDGDETALTSWLTFSTEFKGHFGDSTPAETAVRKLKGLYMGTKTAEQYNTLFNNLKAATKWNNAALIDRYKTGLTDSIRVRNG
jgi:hypothetical protein